MTNRQRRQLLAMIVFSISCLIAADCKGEAGLSEVARARAFWLTKPYALEKSGDADIGPDTVTLIRGRKATIGEKSGFFPIAPCGIRCQERLVGQITSYARGDKFLVMITSDKLPEYVINEGPAAVVDLLNPNATVSWFQSKEDALAFCKEDQALASNLSWLTFEQGFERSKGLFSVYFNPFIIAVIIFAGVLIWFRVRLEPISRFRSSTKFMCIFSILVTFATTLIWLQLSHGLAWITAVFSGIVALIAFARSLKLKASQPGVSMVYRNSALVAIIYGCFQFIILTLFFMSL